MKFRTLGAMTLVFVSLLGGEASAASADTGEVAPEVAYALKVEPGGVSVDYWNAVWPKLDMTLTVPSTVSRAAVGKCASGRVCAFNGYGASGTYLSWGSCGSHSTSALSGSVRSIANARSSGTLKARNGTTVLATAGAGSSANVYGSTTNVYC